MSQIYKTVHDAFKLAAGSRDAERNARASRKAMKDAIKDTFSALASAGEPGCILRGNPEMGPNALIQVLKYAEASLVRIDGFPVVDVPADLIESVSRDLATDKFVIQNRLDGLKRVLWESDLPVDGNIGGGA